MRKATIIVIAAIYVASIVIVGVFGLRALNFEQTVFIKDIEMPETIGGQPVETSDNKTYSVTLTYSAGMEVLIDYDKSPRDAQGDIKVTITTQISYDPQKQEDPVAEIDTEQLGCVLKIYQTGFVIVRFEATDGNKIYKELVILIVDKGSN